MIINFSGMDRGSALGRAVRWPLSLIPARTRLPILQGPLRGRRWIVGSSNHGCWLGSYERDQQRVLEQNLSTGQVVFDVGAHVGFYTLLASALVGTRGQVVAFEPVPGNLDYLKEHLRINSVDNVQLVEAAASDRHGTARLSSGPSSSMWQMQDQGQLEVETVSLDELVDSGRAPPPDLVKMDIEGAELVALDGSAGIIDRYRPVFILSTHGSALHRSCCELLRDAGYALTPIDASSVDSSSEILARHEARPPPRRAG